MNELNELKAKIQIWLSGLNPRERRLVIGGGVIGNLVIQAVRTLCPDADIALIERAELPRVNPNIKSVTCPVTGEELAAVPAHKLDCAGALYEDRMFGTDTCTHHHRRWCGEPKGAGTGDD